MKGIRRVTKMGIFKKNTKSSPSRISQNVNPDMDERIALSSKVKSFFYPHTNEREYFFKLAFPETFIKSENEYFNWMPKMSKTFNPQDVKILIHEFIDQKISLDELTNLLFDFKTFGEFINYTQEEKGINATAVSEYTASLIKSEPISASWLQEIASGYVDRLTTSWLEDLGDRKSTHSSVGSLFQVRVSDSLPYEEAAVIGFRTINYVIKKNGGKFNVNTTQEAGDSLVSDCCTFRGTAVNPLDLINPEVREFVDQLIDGLDKRLKLMLGESPTKDKVFFSGDPMPYRDTLFATANGGAMMASIGFDPSGCKFFDGYGLNKKIREPYNSQWFRR
jgi:hypothetical protein